MTVDPAVSPETAQWRQQAACVGSDPQLFTDPRPGTDDVRLALATCARCTVRVACLSEALARPADADVGIWGATTEEARRALRRDAPIGDRPQQRSHGLFPTLDGDLTDLTGRALVTQLPAAPRHLLFIDRRPALRSDSLDQVWDHITATLDELQPDVLAPFGLTGSGDLTDPSGRALITRLPAPPHLLVVIDGRAHARTDRLDHARRRAVAALELGHPDGAQLEYPVDEAARVDDREALSPISRSTS
jgi:WhiB family transcriptional regulator, redox-sensing transcriptional regulator